MLNPEFSRLEPNARFKADGFTLVELLVAMTMSIFLIGGILLMQQSARTASLEGERLSRAQESMRFSSDFIVREMRNAGFRDQLSLTLNEFNEIGEEFAAIENGRLRLRFSGLGSCAEPFTTTAGTAVAKIIENEYFVDDGVFKCEGSVDGGSSKTIELVSGVKSASFEFICPAAKPNCTCELWLHGDDFQAEREILEQTCQGVRIGLELEGPGPDADPVAVEMIAGFRNIILGRMMWASVPE